MSKAGANTRRSFYMVRHGQSEDNVQRILSSPDTPLTALGREQARELSNLYAAIFPDPALSYVVASDMTRAIETATIMADSAEIRQDNRLCEHRNGVLSGRVSSEKWKEMQKNYSDLRGVALSRDRYKGMETDEAQYRRVIEAVSEHLEICPAGQEPVFVCHHGSLGAVAEALNMVNRKFKNAGMYHFVYDETQEQWNAFEMKLEHGKAVAYDMGAESANHVHTISGFEKPRISSSAR